MTKREAVERMTTTHQIDRERVGDISACTDDQLATLLADMADGELGGLSSSQHGHPGAPTVLQVARISTFAEKIWGTHWPLKVRVFINEIYGNIITPSGPISTHLTRRQAARIIIELDQKHHTQEG